MNSLIISYLRLKKWSAFLLITCTACALMSSCADVESEGTTFLKYYGDANDNVGVKIVNHRSGGYVIGSYTTVGDSLSFPLLARLDQAGNKVWEYEIRPDTNNQVLNDFEVDTDGDYVVLATVDKQVSDGVSRQDMRIVKITEEGEILWFKDFDGGNVLPKNDEASDLIETEDGGYAFIGTTQAGAGNKDLFVVKTDRDGELVWDKIYGNAGLLDDRGSAIVELPSGNFAWFGTEQTNSNGMRPRLVLANSLGNIVSEVDYPLKDSQGNGLEGANVSAGGMVSDGGRLFMTGGIDGASYVFSTDLSGNLQWSTIDDPDVATNEVGIGLVLGREANLVVVGINNVEGATTGDIYFANFSTNGSLIWEQTYGLASREVATSVIPVGQEGYALVGTANLDNTNRLTFVMKTDLKGMLSE